MKNANVNTEGDWEGEKEVVSMLSASYKFIKFEIVPRKF